MMWIVLWFAASLIVALLWAVTRRTTERDRWVWRLDEPVRHVKRGSHHG